MYINDKPSTQKHKKFPCTKFSVGPYKTYTMGISKCGRTLVNYQPSLSCRAVTSCHQWSIITVRRVSKCTNSRVDLVESWKVLETKDFSYNGSLEAPEWTISQAHHCRSYIQNWHPCNHNPSLFKRPVSCECRNKTYKSHKWLISRMFYSSLLNLMDVRMRVQAQPADEIVTKKWDHYRHKLSNIS